MEANRAADRLEHNARSIAALFSGVDDESARWRWDPQAWSLLEVTAHLYDEEREDFRTRLRILLNDPSEPWPPIDPAGWVIERRYNDREPATALHEFLVEREKSILWLRSLETPNWSTSGPTPWGSTMTAGQMLHCWLAHDMLHIRQMAEIHHKHLEVITAPASVDYAGGW